VSYAPAIGRRLKKKRERRQGRRRAARAVQRVRDYFSSVSPVQSDVEPPDDLEGGLGVREPRRPLHPSLSGSVALETPPDDTGNARAVGDEGRA